MAGVGDTIFDVLEILEVNPGGLSIFHLRLNAHKVLMPKGIAQALSMYCLRRTPFFSCWR